MPLRPFHRATASETLPSPFAALIGAGNSWMDGDWANTQQVKQNTTLKGTLGWATMGSPDVHDDGTGVGYIQCAAGIDEASFSNLQTFGYGVQAGSYQPGHANVPYGTFTPTSGWKVGGVTNGAWTYAAPGNVAWNDATSAYDGAVLPFQGVCVWEGLRPEGGNVLVDTGESVSSATFFTAHDLPEPATMFLLALGAAALRRRR